MPGNVYAGPRAPASRRALRPSGGGPEEPGAGPSYRRPRLPGKVCRLCKQRGPSGWDPRGPQAWPDAPGIIAPGPPPHPQAGSSRGREPPALSGETEAAPSAGPWGQEGAGRRVLGGSLPGVGAGPRPGLALRPEELPANGAVYFSSVGQGGFTAASTRCMCAINTSIKTRINMYKWAPRMWGRNPQQSLWRWPGASRCRASTLPPSSSERRVCTPGAWGPARCVCPPGPPPGSHGGRPGVGAPPRLCPGVGRWARRAGPPPRPRQEVQEAGFDPEAPGAPVLLEGAQL